MADQNLLAELLGLSTDLRMARIQIAQLTADLKSREEELEHERNNILNMHQEIKDQYTTIKALREGLEKIASEVPAATVFDGLKVVWLDDFWSMQRIARDLLSSTTPDKLADPAAGKGDAVAGAARAEIRKAVAELIEPGAEYMEDDYRAGTRAGIKRAIAVIDSIVAAHPNSMKPDSKAADQSQEIARLREAVAWCYQLAGAIHEPVYVLDNLSALAHGEPAPYEWKAAGCELLEENERLTTELEAAQTIIDEAGAMSIGWKCGQEGLHLLRINSILSGYGAAKGKGEKP